MSGNLSSDRSQDTYETCRTKGLLFGEQRSPMTGKVCLSEYLLDHRTQVVGSYECLSEHSLCILLI